MLKGILLRKFLVLVFFVIFSSPLLACIPCAKNSVALVNKQATPKFPSSYKSDISTGEVTFNLDVISSKTIKNINVIKITPTDLPKSVILQMIKDSSFLLKASGTGVAVLPCSVKSQEFTFEFLLPQKLNIDIELGL